MLANAMLVLFVRRRSGRRHCRLPRDRHVGSMLDSVGELILAILELTATVPRHREVNDFRAPKDLS